MGRVRFELLIAATLATAPAAAGDFGVTPIRLDLDARTRTGVITVTNDGDTRLAFQVHGAEWTQDPAGLDVYADTRDLIYFPQQLQIPPRENRVIRVGYRNPALQREKAYRLFIEELPERRPATEGATVTIALRFGVPVFLRPGAVEHRGEIAELGVSGGSVRSLVRNTGSVHWRINSVRFVGVDADGQTAFEQTLDGWYLLAGASRAYTTAFPAQRCMKMRTVRVEFVGEKLNLQSETPVTAASCS